MIKKIRSFYGREITTNVGSMCIGCFILCMVITAILSTVASWNYDALASQVKGVRSIFYGDAVKIVGDNNTLDLTEWEPSGDNVVYLNIEGVNHLMVCTDIRIQTIDGESQNMLSEPEYIFSGSSLNDNCYLLYSYDEYLSDGTCIQVTKWFQEYDSVHGGLEYDVPISISAGWVQSLNIPDSAEIEVIETH